MIPSPLVAIHTTPPPTRRYRICASMRRASSAQPHVERRELPGRRFDINSRPRTDPQIPVRILPQREHAVVGKQRQRIPVDLAHAMAFLVVAPYTRTPRRKAQLRSGVPPDYGIDGRSIRQHTQIGMLPVADDTAAAGIIPDQPEIEQPEPIFALADVIHTPYGTGVEAGTAPDRAG